jgi:O-antigen/teichoic acid export membrane protein
VSGGTHNYWNLENNMKQLLKSASMMSFTELALIIVAMLRNKYLAVAIGPEGFGAFGLLQSFFTFMSVFAGYWLATPTMKYISEYNAKNDQESVQKVFDFAFVIVFIVATILTVIFFLFAPFIKNTFLSPDIVYLHYALFSASYIGTSLTTIFRSLFQALRHVKQVVYIRIISSVFNLITIVILVSFFDLTGFFINILLSSLFLLFLFWHRGRHLVQVRLVKINYRDNLIKRIISYGTINIILSFVNLISDFLKRLIIIKFSSMSVLGLFQASFSFSSYLSIVSNGALFYYRPKMAERLSSLERNAVFNDYLRITLITGIFISTLAISFGEMGIKILYSESFISLADVFYIFVIAQFILSIQMSLSTIITGMAKLRIHSLVTIIAHAISLMISYYFVRKFGLLAIGYGAILGSIPQILIVFIYLRKHVSLKLRRDNIVLFLCAIALIGVSVLTRDSNYIIKGFLIFTLFITLLVNIKKQEYLSIFYTIKKLLVDKSGLA